MPIKWMNSIYIPCSNKELYLYRINVKDVSKKHGFSYIFDQKFHNKVSTIVIAFRIVTVGSVYWGNIKPVW